MRDSGKDVSTVGRTAFNAISVVDSTFTRFVINIKVLEIIVEINASSTEVPAEECRVRRKNCGNIDMSFAAQRNS
jgi:hypothetical protein